MEKLRIFAQKKLDKGDNFFLRFDDHSHVPNPSGHSNNGIPSNLNVFSFVKTLNSQQAFNIQIGVSRDLHQPLMRFLKIGIKTC